MYKPKQVLKQGDSRWSKILLGFNTSTYTIGSHGCLITCLSMIENITPDVMNAKLKAINGFSNGGFYNWGAFTQLFGIKEKLVMTPLKLTDVQVAEIKAALDKGNPVMCGIDSHPEDADYDMHFVILTEYKGEDFTIADPWTGTIRPLKDYLYGTKPTFRSTVEQYVIYEVVGAPIPTPEAPTANEWQVKFNKLAEYLYGLLGISGDSYDSQKIMTASQQLKEDFTTSKDVIDSQNKAYEQEKLVWESTKDGLDKEKEGLVRDKTLLQQKIDSLSAQLTVANAGSGWNLIARGLTKLIKGGE